MKMNHEQEQRLRDIMNGGATPVSGVASSGSAYVLPPPPHYPTGSIILIRRRGHSRTAGQEYFAPAIVLQQFEPDGQVEVLIFDASSGVCFDSSYNVREVSSRGEGQTREMYVSQENVQSVLFDPIEFNLALSRQRHLSNEIQKLISRSEYQWETLTTLTDTLETMDRRIKDLESLVTDTLLDKEAAKATATAPTPVAPPLSPKGKDGGKS